MVSSKREIIHSSRCCFGSLLGRRCLFGSGCLLGCRLLRGCLLSCGRWRFEILGDSARLGFAQNLLGLGHSGSLIMMLSSSLGGSIGPWTYRWCFAFASSVGGRFGFGTSLLRSRCLLCRCIFGSFLRRADLLLRGSIFDSSFFLRRSLLCRYQYESLDMFHDSSS